MPECYIRFGHDRFLAQPVKFITHYSFYDAVLSDLLRQSASKWPLLSVPVFITISIKFRFILSGSLGQLGVEVARFLRGIYGRENVIMSDIIKPSKEVFNDGSYILSRVRVSATVINYGLWIWSRFIWILTVTTTVIHVTNLQYINQRLIL
jgi:hypothetical protein